MLKSVKLSINKDFNMSYTFQSNDSIRVSGITELK